MIETNLLDCLTRVVAVCRGAGKPLSLLLVQLSDGDELSTACRPEEMTAIREVLGSGCAKLDHPGVICVPYTEVGHALVLPGVARQQAIELGDDLIRTIRTLAVSAGMTRHEGLKLDVGVATIAQPPKYFPPRDLLDGAERCLGASHASGGGTVKSADIY